jgi:NAD(P)-dependent dehydrogenase (short-subunit alcohol dehydrogenase family)
MTWSPKQIPSLAGKTAVVTGANSGIGWHTAAELGKHGAAVTLACRNVQAGEQAASKMRDAGAVDVRVEELDLASQSSVERFAKEWDGPLDVLVNNAGVMTPPKYRQTEDGFELQFGTNHLGHFALTGRLLPALLAASAARVVTVASIAHFRGKADLLEGNPEKGYRPEPAYGNSKLANVLFARELQRRASEHGVALTSAGAHPGVSATELVQDDQGMGSNRLVRTVAPLFVKVVFQSASAGANPSLYAATAAAPGSYTGPQWLKETRGPVGPAKLNPLATDESLATDLWNLSEELTGVSFDWSA